MNIEKGNFNVKKEKGPNPAFIMELARRYNESTGHKIFRDDKFYTETLHPIILEKATNMIAEKETGKAEVLIKHQQELGKYRKEEEVKEWGIEKGIPAGEKEEPATADELIDEAVLRDLFEELWAEKYSSEE
jgi:hypothetical protein